MKQPEYTEGPEALENFKKFAGAILQSSVKKKKRPKKAASQKKTRKSDSD